MTDLWKTLDGRHEVGTDFDAWLAKLYDGLLADYTGPAIEDYVTQNGLVAISTLCTHITVCAAEPTTYALAVTTALLGYYSFGAGNAFGANTSASPTGRLVTSMIITSGTITTTGTAAWWAAVDEVNSRLYAHGSLSASQVVTAGNTFTLGAFTIRIPAQ